MPFRFSRSARLGPLRFNVAKSGQSSITVGGRGAAYNIPLGRPGGARTTVELLDCQTAASSGPANWKPSRAACSPCCNGSCLERKRWVSVSGSKAP